MLRLVTTLLTVGAAVLAGTGHAHAHANLVRCSIHNGQTIRVGHIPRAISAVFSEELDPGKSWMATFEGTGDHGLVPEHQKSAVNYRNPKQMRLALPRVLHRGRYDMLWYTRSAEDDHIAAGMIHFRVG